MIINSSIHRYIHGKVRSRWPLSVKQKAAIAWRLRLQRAEDTTPLRAIFCRSLLFVGASYAAS